MGVLTVSEARATLPSLLDRVEEGEQFTITRHGRPVAVLAPPTRADLVWHDRRRDIEARIEAVQRSLDEARGKPISGELTVERAEELVAAIRAERDSW